MTDREIETIQQHLDRCQRLWENERMLLDRCFQLGEHERVLLEEVKKLRKWIEGIRFSTITALEYVDKDQYYEFLKDVPEEAAELLGLKEASGITARRKPPLVSGIDMADRPTINLDINLDNAVP